PTGAWEGLVYRRPRQGLTTGAVHSQHIPGRGVHRSAPGRAALCNAGAVQTQWIRVGACNQGLPHGALPLSAKGQEVIVNSSRLFRDQIAVRLVEDLVGPLSEREIIADRPSQRYSTGILYPQGARIEAEENQDGGAP